MSVNNTLRAVLLTAAALSALGQPLARAADPPVAAPRASRESGPPRLYVATGPTSEAELARLRAAIGKLAGVTKVETRVEFEAITVTIDGDSSSTESLRGAAARSVGFVMRAVLPRYLDAAGPTREPDLARLRAALEKVHGVARIELSAQPAGAAVRVLGVTPFAELAAAGRSAGYALRALGSYVVSGSGAEKDLARLRGALAKVAGVERVELQGLTGGATLLIHGDVREHGLVTAARSAGYALWPLTNTPGPRTFRVESTAGTVDVRRLRETVQNVAEIGQLEVRSGPEGPRLVVTGGRARPDAIVAAAAGAGFNLMLVEPPVSLPTLEPAAGRSTPPDYDERVLEGKARVGEAAPGFTLLGMDGAAKKTLPDLLALGKPVVLVFGSCSCPRFIAACPPLEQLYRTYRDRVTFQLVYIAESHPGQILSFPTDNGGKELRVVPLLTTQSESLGNLRRLMQLASLTVPAAIESPANSLNRDYAAYPNRLYVIGVDGKVKFQGAPGPTGFKVPELADWLQANLK